MYWRKKKEANDVEMTSKTNEVYSHEGSTSNQFEFYFPSPNHYQSYDSNDQKYDFTNDQHVFENHQNVQPIFHIR